jgi:phosphatidylserine/phosphatidylglycerophosphate/cardiolipin synthase-like enzyme
MVRGLDSDIPPLRALMNLFLAATSFIHVTTFGLDEFTLAMLEMAAQRVPVCALVSGVDDKTEKLLPPVEREAPDLDLRAVGGRRLPGDQVHGKLIVIDGILALSGSANLTHKAWRKAALNMEIVEVLTDTERVANLNDRYFASHWAASNATVSDQAYIAAGWRLVSTSTQGAEA